MLRSLQLSVQYAKHKKYTYVHPLHVVCGHILFNKCVKSTCAKEYLGYVLTHTGISNMTAVPTEHYVYKKDNEGSTYKIGEIVFENQILQHDPSFTNVYSTLKELPQFPTRKDDIWIIGYSKSGQCFQVPQMNIKGVAHRKRPDTIRHINHSFPGGRQACQNTLDPISLF